MEKQTKQQVRQKNLKASDEVHRKLKIYVAKTGEQINDFVERAVLNLMKQENGKQPINQLNHIK